MKITVETIVKAQLDQVWAAWNNPADIKQWNSAQDDWHTTGSTVDLRIYTGIVPQKTIEYRMSDGREVKVEFAESADGVQVKETFDAESENPPELQRQGWQTILDNFRRHVEAGR